MATVNSNLDVLNTVNNVNRWAAPSNRVNYFNLDLNENYLGKREDWFLNLLRNFDPAVVSRYPEYDQILKEISKYTDFSSKNIILTNGADQGIELVCRLFFGQKSKVLVPSPVFSYYYHTLNLLGSIINPIFYIKSNNTFIFPLEQLLNYIDNADGVILCNPNNPLGSNINLNAIEQIIIACAQRKIPCIIDEAYFEFNEHTSAKYVNQYSNLLVIRSFSKFFCLAGLRLGYIIASEEIISNLLKIRGPWDVNHFSVFAGIECLRNVNYFIHKKNIVNKIKQSLYNFFDTAKIPYYQSNTNFICIHDMNGDLRRKFDLDKINVNDVSSYPFSNGMLKDHIRITIPHSDDLSILMKSLQRQPHEVKYTTI